MSGFDPQPISGRVPRADEYIDTSGLRTVTGCADCPFHVEQELQPDFCDAADRRYLYSAARKPGHAPDWCPLREGDITVRLER